MRTLTANDKSSKPTEIGAVFVVFSYLCRQFRAHWRAPRPDTYTNGQRQNAHRQQPQKRTKELKNKNTHIKTLHLNISRCLARYTSLFVIVVAIVAFLAPESFAWVQEGQRASVILGLIMLTIR